MAQVTAKSRPEAADAVVSYDGRLQAAHAAALITPTVSAAGRARAGALARAALRHDPTTVSAAATLGLVALTRNDSAGSRNLLAYAQRLSRRNVQTQLWSIEDAVGRGDIAGALRWYDVALRTKPALSDVLYPVLAQASRDPAIRSVLTRTLAGRPPWSDSFVSYAASQKDDPQSTAALFANLRAQRIAIPASAQASLVNVLLDGGYPEQAWRYYAAIRPGADRARARDSRFTALLEMPSLLDWVTPTNNGIAASIQRTREGGLLDFSAPASVGGAMLQQVQLLPAGTYRLAGHSDGISQEARALPYWTLVCRGDGREVARVIMPNSSQGGGMFGGIMTVPADCPVQTLTLFAQPSDAVGGLAGQINRVALTPVA